MDTKNTTSEELFTAGKWFPFLESLPIGTTDWKVSDYKKFLSLRTSASILSNREGGERRYSIKVSANDSLKLFVEVKKR